jgi:DNA-binding transcriptional LysR family regulator
VVARRGHPLAELAAPRWEDTDGYPWILPPPGTLSRVRLDQAVSDAGMPPPRPAVETSSLVALLSMLQDRDYIATLASSVAQMYERWNLISIVRMPSRLEFGPIGMLWAANSPSIVLPDLCETLREEAKRLLEGGGAGPAAAT